MGSDDKRFRIINAAQLTIEPYDWLIEGILPARGVTLLYGDSNVYKTFLGISMTAAVAAKPSWMGYKTQKAVSLYIATEGYDIPIRHRGWQIQHGVHVPHDANYIIEDLSIYELKTMELLRDRIKEQGIHPGLITIDILADAILPGNEVDNRDMSIFAGNFKSLLDEFDAAGLLVHHTGKDGLRERGASALRPKLEASYKITEGKGVRNVSMVCDKMKSGQKPKQLILHLDEVLVPLEGKYQKTLAVKGLVNILDRTGDEVTPGAEQLLEVLASQFTAGATSSEWQRAAGLTDSTFKRHRKELENAGRITGGGGRDAKYYVAAQPKPASIVSEHSNEVGSSPRVQSSPYKGAGPLDPSGVGSNGPYLDPSGPEPYTESCKNVDTTQSHPPIPNSGGGSDESHVHEGERVATPTGYRMGADGYPVSPGHPEYAPGGDLVADVIKHLKVKPAKP